jgi:hypothetical protein
VPEEKDIGLVSYASSMLESSEDELEGGSMKRAMQVDRSARAGDARPRSPLQRGPDLLEFQLAESAVAGFVIRLSISRDRRYASDQDKSKDENDTQPADETVITTSCVVFGASCVHRRAASADDRFIVADMRRLFK